MNFFRTVLFLLLAGAWSVAVASQSKEWRFRVFLDDKEIGYHHFELRPSEGGARLLSEAELNVKVLFINAYDYVHRNEEWWNGDCLVQLRSTTDDNGKQYKVEGLAQQDSFVIETRTDREDVRGCVRSFAYWSPEVLKDADRLLNAQTGEYVPVRLDYVGREPVTARGTVIDAERYRLSGEKLVIDLWYSEGREWVGLESITEGDRRLSYRIQ
jgi:hypothetical protein